MFFLKKYDVIMICVYVVLAVLAGIMHRNVMLYYGLLGIVAIMILIQIYTIITRVCGEKRYKEEKDQYYKNNCNTRNSSFLSDLKGLKKREK